MSIIEEKNPEPEQMSAEKFRKTLLTWFQTRGVVSELKAHLRHQVIEMLKETTLNSTIPGQIREQSVLPLKANVINLLIAEYFMRQNYHYSLSTFSAEVPITPVLIASSTSYCIQEQNFWDVLNSLNFTHDRTERKMLYELYFNKVQGPLLVCLLHLHSKINENKGEQKEEDNLELLRKPWTEEVNKILQNFNISFECFRKLKDVIEKETTRIRKEESDHFENLQNQIENDMKVKETEITHIINDMEETFFTEKQKFVNSLNEKRKELENVNKMHFNKEKEFEEKILSFQNNEILLKQHEHEMLQEIEMLKNRAKLVQNDYDMFVENSKKNHEKFENKMTQTEKDEEQLLTSKILNQVQIENAQLRIVNSEQQRRLDELTRRNFEILNDLSNSQTAINILSRNLRNVNETRATPTPPPLPRHTTGNLSERSGAGENSTYPAPPPRPRPTLRHLHHLPHPHPDHPPRRKPPRHPLIEREDSSSSNESATDEILQEARIRLRRLEQETEAVDRNYRAFRQRHTQRIRENPHRENAHSATSSGIVPLLGNLSVSSIDLSSENDDINSPERDIN